MTRTALTLKKLFDDLMVYGVPLPELDKIERLYKDAYREGYHDGQLDTEEAHEDEWVNTGVEEL